MPLLKAGNVATPGEIVPRGFPAVLAKRRYDLQAGLGPSRAGRSDLQRRPGTRRARDRQSRLGLALRASARRHAERFRHAGRQADASGAARRSGGALHRERLVAEVAAAGDHAVGDLPAGQHAAGRRAESRRRQRAAVAAESAPPRYRVVSRHAPAIRRHARRRDVRSVRRSGQRRRSPPHDLRTHQPRAHAAAVAAVRLSGRHAVISGSRAHDHVAAADVRDEQRVHAEPRCGGGEDRGGGDRRSRTGAACCIAGFSRAIRRRPS